jgi:hypothetical protein
MMTYVSVTLLFHAFLILAFDGNEWVSFTPQSLFSVDRKLGGTQKVLVSVQKKSLLLP